jgi:hypothetical protein
MTKEKNINGISPDMGDNVTLPQLVTDTDLTRHIIADVKNDIKRSYEHFPENAYTFTVNPNDKNQFAYRTPLRMNRVYTETLTMLQTVLGDLFQWELYTEIKQITKSVQGQFARIHFHGIIILTPKQHVKLLCEKMHRLSQTCSIEIDSIQHPSVWHKYINKDRSGMVDYCAEEKTPSKMVNGQRHKISLKKRPQGFFPTSIKEEKLEDSSSLDVLL